MENLFSITISDFQEKIHFFNIKPTFSFDQTFHIVKSLNKSICVNYINEFLNKNFEFRLMDTTINSKIKVKVSILGEIIVSLLYDSEIDIHYLNHVNTRIIEALYNIKSKLKK